MKQQSRRTGVDNSRGFGLLEVLVAVLVLSIGLTGTALLMATSLKNSESGYLRSQATILAYAMGDRMRANRGSTGDTGSALGGAYDGVTLCDKNARHGDDSRACQLDEASDISGAGVKNSDLAAWWNDLDLSGLPNWYAGVLRNGKVVTVVVQWDDTRALGRRDRRAALPRSCLDDAEMPGEMQQICISSQI